MYFFDIIFGLLCVLMFIINLKSEYADRKVIARRAFGNTEIIVYNGCDTQKEGEYHYPIRSTEYTCGRRPKFSRLKADITAPGEDKFLSTRAAVFHVQNGSFCIERKNQSEIWIKDTEGKVFLLSKNNDKKHNIPECFVSVLQHNPTYEYNGNSMVIYPGYTIIMGETLFKYNCQKEAQK